MCLTLLMLSQMGNEKQPAVINQSWRVVFIILLIAIHLSRLFEGQTKN